jgi:TolA-binding protein
VLLEKIDPSKRAIYLAAKGDASYWLGLLSYDLGKYPVAKNWLAVLTLAANPDGPWTTGARYNLARTLEALGDLPAAIELLESNDSPQRYGNVLRARQLRQQLKSTADE